MELNLLYFKYIPIIQHPDEKIKSSVTLATQEILVILSQNQYFCPEFYL
jgi:hypothetical protein